MHSIASVFAREKDLPCPTCLGAKRVLVEGVQQECYHCGGKGFVKLTE